VQNLASTLGRNLDPLVDKVLMCGAFISLLPRGSADGWLAPWMVTLIVARELIITSLCSYLESYGARFGADWLGKAKMILQCAAVMAIFIALESPHWFPGLTTAWGWVRNGLIWAMLAATLFSGLQYLWKAAVLFRNDNMN